MRKGSRVLVTCLSSIAVLAVACAAVPAPASAQSSPAQDHDIRVGNLASLTIKRARRAIAFGPFVGAMPIIPTSGDPDGAISFGWTWSWFKIPILLDQTAIEQIVRDRAEALLKKAVAAAVLRGEQPTAKDLATLGREIYEQVLAEFFQERAPRVWERPRFHAHLEATRLFRAESWQSRMTIALGFGRISLGPTLMLDFDDDTDLFLGPELTVQLLPWKSVRSPVMDIFLRMDFALTEDERDSLVSLGGRFVLDLI